MNNASVADRSEEVSVIPPSEDNAPRLRVLLVEPDPRAALELRRHLAPAGTNVSICHVSGALAALRKLQDEPLDCVLLEPALPDASGLAACDAFLAHPTQLPVVVLSAQATPELALEAVKRGVQDWLVKGESSPEAITRALQFALARRNNELHLRSVRERLLEIEAEATSRVSAEHRSLDADSTSDERLGFALNQLRDAIGEAKLVVDDVRGRLTPSFAV